MCFENVYEDDHRADAYARLEFPGTYYLAFRDIPGLIKKHVTGNTAIDFGCGAGRSTRFLKKLGFDCFGVDISEHMLRKARQLDPEGDYRCVRDCDPDQLDCDSVDLILSAFTFDNIPTAEKKAAIFSNLRALLKPSGRIINLVSSPDIYINEWASFTTLDFPENRRARSGDRVRIIMTDVDDRRPVEDIVWSDADYHRVYSAAGLNVTEKIAPLGHESEPFDWISETHTAPWVIYVLEPV